MPMTLSPSTAAINFPSLPLLVQERITDHILDRSHPNDVLAFSLASRLTYYLTKSREKRFRRPVQQLPLMVGPDLYLYISEMMQLRTEEDICRYLNSIAVMEQVHFEYCTQQPESAEVLERVLPALIGAMRHVKHVNLYVTIDFSDDNQQHFIRLFRQLERATKLHLSLIAPLRGRLVGVYRLLEAMPHLTILEFNGRFAFTDADWNLLLRRSSPDFPLERLDLPPLADFSLHAMQRFFMIAHLARNVSVRVTGPIDEERIRTFTNAFLHIGERRHINRTFVSFQIRGSVVTVHFRDTTALDGMDCKRPFRSYDEDETHPCELSTQTMAYKTSCQRRVPRFFHP